MKQLKYSNFSEYLNEIHCHENINAPNKLVENLKKALPIILNVEDMRKPFFDWLHKNKNFVFMIEKVNDLKKIEAFEPSLLRAKDSFGNNYLHHLFHGSYESASKKAIIDLFLQNYPSLFLEENDLEKKPVDLINTYSEISNKIKVYVQSSLIKISQDGKEAFVPKLIKIL